MKNCLIALGGATGSGKTNLALHLAQHFPQLVILSADSRQIYKYLNVGTGKIGQPAIDYRLTGQAEPVRLAGGKSQYLVDLVEPNIPFTLVDYQRAAYRLIRASWRQAKIPLLVGGTGLYIQALIEGYVIKGGVNPDLRRRLASLNLADLQARLTRLGVEVAPGEGTNRRRLIRALERAEQGVGTISRQHRRLTTNSQVFVLERPWEEQRLLAPAMVRERLNLGLVEEVKILLQNGVERDWLRGMGLSYRLVLEMLDGQLPESELERRLNYAFRRLMRRQRTWFNRMPYASKLTPGAIGEAVGQLLSRG